MATKAEKALISEKSALAREVRNIQRDYENVLPEDMPAEVTAELKTMRERLRQIRELLDGPND